MGAAHQKICRALAQCHKMCKRSLLYFLFPIALEILRLSMKPPTGGKLSAILGQRQASESLWAGVSEKKFQNCNLPGHL